MTDNRLPETERHPLEPFIPEGAVLLMLGSFPPQRKRWSMDFYYPNLQNDMWRIFGVIFFNDKSYFLEESGKHFCKERIIAFLCEKGIGIYDTATQIRRLQDNASDKFLEVVEPTDVGKLLERMPCCKAIVTTGQKATDILCEQLHATQPTVGGYSEFITDTGIKKLYRILSSSRAYPLALEKKSSLLPQHV
ncbi:MAG: uracil-DNA glycosylase family protein [Bacteroides sp.]|nr:uracil-DNA glycosylase family protein [Bacteroides sp.]